MLSLQDVGFVGAAGTSNPLFYSQEIHTDEMGGGMYGITYAQGGTYFEGSSSALIGKTIGAVGFFIKRIGSPTGTLSFKAITFESDATGTTNQTWTPSETDVSAISTSGEWIESTGETSYVLAANDVITPYCSDFGSSDSSNKLELRGKGSLSITGQRWCEFNTSEYWNTGSATNQGNIRLYSTAAP